MADSTWYKLASPELCRDNSHDDCRNPCWQFLSTQWLRSRVHTRELELRLSWYTKLQYLLYGFGAYDVTITGWTSVHGHHESGKHNKPKFFLLSPYPMDVCLFLKNIIPYILYIYYIYIIQSRVYFNQLVPSSSKAYIQL